MISSFIFFFLIMHSHFTPTTAANNRIHYFHPFFPFIIPSVFREFRSHTESGRNVNGRRRPRYDLAVPFPSFSSFCGFCCCCCCFSGSLFIYLFIYFRSLRYLESLFRSVCSSVGEGELHYTFYFLCCSRREISLRSMRLEEERG